MYIRKASIDDLDIIADVEGECFPTAEACDRNTFRERLTYYPECFRLMFDGDRLVSFVDGFVTDERNLTDEMYEKASMHNPDGRWQMIFGVNTIPEYRRRGYAGELLRLMIEDAKKENRLGLVLTCKEKLIPFYTSFGFVNEGVSASVHGNAVWYQMRLEF